MEGLTAYLEKNGFYPCEEDLNAILRRCDHDANRMINFAEFCEMTGVKDNTGNVPQNNDYQMQDLNERDDFDSVEDYRSTNNRQYVNQNALNEEKER